MTTLQPATTNEFAAYFAYALSDPSADKLTRLDLERHFPDGVPSKGRHPLSIRAADGVQVGFLWFLVAERATGPEAFLMDLVIFPPFRRNGHATEAMTLLESRVHELGLERISLSVSSDNPGARTLYDSLGYDPVFTRMTKQCRPQNIPAADRAADRMHDG